jgi:hypothetical protein
VVVGWGGGGGDGREVYARGGVVDVG